MSAKTKRDEAVVLVPPSAATIEDIVRIRLGFVEDRIDKLESLCIRNHNLLVQVLEALES